MKVLFDLPFSVDFIPQHMQTVGSKTGAETHPIGTYLQRMAFCSPMHGSNQ
jgi:hypothetical protein